jgi:apolipoprotein D and lipocalin family protein
MIRATLIAILGLLSLGACQKAQPLQAVPQVDLQRYAGLWYEIASYPQRFQKGCHNTTAQYTPTTHDYILVQNQCNKDSLNGRQSSVLGKAFIEPGTGNAKLKVQFFWPFKGKYWIIDLDPDYNYAVVSHPNRKYLWILARQPQLNDSVYNAILARLEQKEFDLSKLQKTLHHAKQAP